MPESMPVAATALYAALLALLQIALAALVGRERIRSNISLGDGGDPALLEAIRRHANFLEQVPLTLLLLALLELNGASPVAIHGLGGTLLLVRLIHPFGLDSSEANRLPRLIGAAGTMLVQLVAIAMLLWQVVAG